MGTKMHLLAHCKCTGKMPGPMTCHQQCDEQCKFTRTLDEDYQQHTRLYPSCPVLCQKSLCWPAKMREPA